ncbi:MAG: hypothetical protein JXR56_05880, partial [Candidatus Cloacimonetes bacterium]|nr:hypothetical protein [Candidatus Cloacimonadota bacterium]
MKVKSLIIYLVFALCVVTLSAELRNVAPVLDISYEPVMTTILEGEYDNAGNSLAEIINPASIVDGDGNSVVAIAVKADDNTDGIWQYSLNNGASWFDFTALTGQIVSFPTAARLLDGSLTGAQTNRVRFVPAVDYPDTLAWTPPEISYDGRSSFNFRAWDRSNGITGLTADTSLNGGSTAFSSLSDVVRIVVSAVNDDPILYYQGQEVTGVVHMGFSIDEDTSFHFQPGQCNVDDPDMGDNQIIFNVQATKGILQFVGVRERFISGNGTSNVTIVTDIPELNYILDECSNYIPNLNANSTEVLTIRLNDQGWTGIGGGEDQIHLHTFWINPINDAPVLNTSFSPSLTTIQEDDVDNQGNSVGSIIPNGSITDVDTLAVEAIAITGVDNRNGHWEYSLDDGVNWIYISDELDTISSFENNALLLDGTLTGVLRHRVRFLPAPDFYGTSTFTFRAWDITEGNSGTRFDATINGGITSISAVSDAASITVSSINDVPALYYKGQHEADTLQVFIPITSPMVHLFVAEDSLDIVDPDIGTNVMMANIISQKGTMTFHNLSSRYISNNGSNNVTVTGTLSELNSRLDNVTYQAPVGETGYDFIDFVMSDFGYSGAGPVLNISNMMWIQLTNESPVYDSIPITTAYEDSLYEYLIYTSDADTNRVWIDASLLPNWLTITDNGDNTALLSGIPTNDDVGANPVSLDIWDWVTPDAPVHQDFIINVVNTNDAPHFTSVPVLQVDEGSLYQYFVTAEDIDGGSSLTLAATVMPTWMNFVDNGDGTGLLSGTPLNMHVGFHPVTLTLTDGIIDATVNQIFNVEVIDVNSAPYVNVPIPDQTAEEDFTPDIVLNMDNYFADVDPGTTLYYSVVYDTLQISAEIVDSDLILSPIPDWNGTTELTVTADDRHASAGRRSPRTRDITTDSFFVTLTPFNDAPRFVTAPVRVVTENTTYNYNARAIEVDAGDPIFMGASVLPTWMTFTDIGNGRGLLTGPATSALLGYHPVTLTATDNIIPTPATQSFNVYVNSIPIYTTTPVLSVDEDSFYIYNIGATDNNPDAVLAFSAVGLPSWLTLVDNGDGTAVLSGTPLNEDVGNNSVTIRLSDGFVSTPVLQTFTINVINTNDAPYFTSAPETISNVGFDYIYNITAADDDVTDNLQFASSVLPTWLTLIDNGDRTASLQGHPLPSDEGLENITLYLTDGNIVIPVEQNFILEVRDENV